MIIKLSSCNNAELLEGKVEMLLRMKTCMLAAVPVLTFQWNQDQTRLTFNIWTDKESMRSEWRQLVLKSKPVKQSMIDRGVSSSVWQWLKTTLHIQLVGKWFVMWVKPLWDMLPATPLFITHHLLQQLLKRVRVHACVWMNELMSVTITEPVCGWHQASNEPVLWSDSLLHPSDWLTSFQSEANCLDFSLCDAHTAKTDETWLQNASCLWMMAADLPPTRTLLLQWHSVGAPAEVLVIVEDLFALSVCAKGDVTCFAIVFGTGQCSQFICVQALFGSVWGVLCAPSPPGSQIPWIPDFPSAHSPSVPLPDGIIDATSSHHPFPKLLCSLDHWIDITASEPFQFHFATNLSTSHPPSTNK